LFVAVAMGMGTVVSLHYVLLKRIKGFTISRWWVWVSLGFGSLSMLSLFLYALTPTEKQDLGTSIVALEESVLLLVYNITAVLHA
jgi:hypothetical protein